MSDFRINQALQEMQAMAAQARGTRAPAEPADGADFGDLLKRAVDGVNALQTDSSQKTDAFLRGEEVALTDVMVASQKAKVGFEAVKEVRNRLLEAYQEVSRMQL